MAEGLGFEPSHNDFRDRRATFTLALNIKIGLSRNRTYASFGLQPGE